MRAPRGVCTHAREQCTLLAGSLCPCREVHVQQRTRNVVHLLLAVLVGLAICAVIAFAGALLVLAGVL